MKVRKEWIGSKKPAALGNLAELQEDIHADLSEISQKMATKEDAGKLQRAVAAILKVVQSIEGRLKDMASHEDRIKRIEKAIFFRR